jgi:hypothetical protein
MGVSNCESVFDPTGRARIWRKLRRYGVLFISAPNHLLHRPPISFSPPPIAKHSAAIIRSCFDCRIKFRGDAFAHVLFSSGRIPLFFQKRGELCGPWRSCRQNAGAEMKKEGSAGGLIVSAGRWARLRLTAIESMKWSRSLILDYTHAKERLFACSPGRMRRREHCDLRLLGVKCRAWNNLKMLMKHQFKLTNNALYCQKHISFS